VHLNASANSAEQSQDGLRDLSTRVVLYFYKPPNTYIILQACFEPKSVAG